jgi:Restriction endonuclease S subunits
MAKWVEYTIGDVAQIFDGPHATPKKTSEGPWFLSISSLDRGRLNLAESTHLSEEDFARWTRRVTPQEGDILFSYETRLGEAALMPANIRACLGRRMGLLRPKRSIVEPKFLLYAYLSPAFQEIIATRRVHGATVDRIPLVELPSWPISLPPLSEQQAICGLLGALDDKIAVNERIVATTNALISAMFAQLLASSREVHKVPLGDVALVNMTSVKPSENGVLRYVDISAVGVGSYDWPELIKWSDAPGRARRKAQFGDTIWSTVRPNRRSHALVLDDDPDLVFSTGLAILTPRSVGSAFLYEATRTPDFQKYLESVAEGSAYPAVRAELFKAAPIPLPAADERTRFEYMAMAMRLRAHQAVLENRTLAALRDTLLPELMSGRLCVRDAEKLIEDTI